MLTPILWQPEVGTCSHCGGRLQIRRFTADGVHIKFCHGCWNHTQDECTFTPIEWVNNFAFIFADPGDNPSIYLN
jgi:hypothetical protein